jgi:GxxExxY protein
VALRNEDLTSQILGAAIQVHQRLGPGLLESVYAAALAIELGRRAVRFTREVKIPVNYDGETLDTHFRLDFLVDDRVVVEVKAVEQLAKVHEAQLLTYLRLGGFPVGLLLNFNVVLMKQGIVRRIL